MVFIEGSGGSLCYSDSVNSKGTAHPKMKIQSLSTQAPPVQLDSRVKFHSRQNVSGASPQSSPKQLR